MSPAHRRDLRGGGAAALRSARDGADRHGRFRRRHAQISAHAIPCSASPSPAASPRSPSSRKACSIFIPRADASSLARWLTWRGRAAGLRSWRAASSAPTPRLRLFAPAASERLQIGDEVAKRGAWRSRRRCSPALRHELDIVIFDREGKLAGRCDAEAGSCGASQAVAAPIVRVIERAVAEIFRSEHRGRPGSAPCAPAGSSATSLSSVPSVASTMRSSGQLARTTTATGQSAP